MAGVSTTITTQRNPAFLDFAGGDGQVTTGEKIASMKGVASRGTSGTTTARCRKGKACGATCIDAREDCIIDFPLPVQNEIRRMAKFLMEKKGIAGASSLEAQQRFLQEDELGKAAMGLGKQLTKEVQLAKRPTAGDPSTVEKSRGFGKKKSWGEKQILHAEEIRDLKSRRDTIGDAQDKPELLKAWQKDVQSRGVSLKKEDLEALYDSLPRAAQGQLKGSGNPNRKKGDELFYWVDKDGNERTDGKSGTRSRGLAVLDMYMKQGGTDAYSSNKSRILSPANMDVEHITPVSKGGRDHPDNWVLARAGAQRLRSDQHLGKWIDSLPDPNNRAAIQDYVSFNAQKTRAKKALRQLSSEVYKNRQNMTDEEWSKVTLGKRTKVVTLPSGKKEKLPVVEAVKQYMFLSPDNEKDGFLGGGFLRNPSQEARAAKAFSAPIGWKQAYAMYHKDHSYDQAVTFRSQIKEAWDGYAKDGKYGVKEATTRVKKLFEDNLTPNQMRIVEKNFNKGIQELNTNYGNIAPKPSIKPSSQPKSTLREKPSPAVAEKPAPRANRLGRGGEKGVGKPNLPRPQAKIDPVQARQKLVAYVQTLKGQGQKDTQIRDQLQKLGIPANLISELV